MKLFFKPYLFQILFRGGIATLAVLTDLTYWLQVDRILTPAYSNIVEFIISILIFIAFIVFEYKLIKNNIKNQNLAKLYKGFYQQSMDILYSAHTAQEVSPDCYINHLLATVFRGSLNFETTERISVYKYDRCDDNFYRIGRHCPDPILNRQGARNILGRPHGRPQGVIGQAFFGNRKNEFFLRELPDFDRDPDKYKEFLEENNVTLPETALARIRMKSRSYYVIRTTGDNGEHNGVIVFESMNSKAFGGLFSAKSRNKIRKMLESEEGQVLKTMIQDRRLPSENRNEGL